MKESLISIGLPDWISIGTEDNVISQVYEDGKALIDGICVQVTAGVKKTKISLVSPVKPIKWLKLRWNTKLPGNIKLLGDAWERGYGDMEWRGHSAKRFLPWYFLEKQEEYVLGYGVMTGPSALCFWQVDTKGITLYMDVRCGGQGVILRGRVLQVASVIVRKYTECTAFESGKAFCSAMCPTPVFPKTPVYGSNNWYYAYGDTSAEDILMDTEYLMKLTEDCRTIPYMVIDDGWQVSHRIDEYNGGPWRKGNYKFPDMKGLAQNIRKKGAEAGIWMRPLLNEDPSIPDEWRLSINGCLDPTHPEALEYIKEDIRCICEWGYSLIKHDFTTYDLFGRWGFEMNPLVTKDGWSFSNKNMTSAEVVKLLYKAIWDASRPYDSVILGCNTIGHLGAGMMQLSRIGDDTSGKNWERTRNIGINSLAFRLIQHGTFYDVDADCVGIAGPIPWKFNKQWADVIARSGTSLFISAKPGILTDEENRELSEIMRMASAQKHHAVPVDWMGNDCPEIWGEDGDRVSYDWYESSGLSFTPDSERYMTYLSCF